MLKIFRAAFSAPKTLFLWPVFRSPITFQQEFYYSFVARQWADSSSLQPDNKSSPAVEIFFSGNGDQNTPVFFFHINWRAILIFIIQFAQLFQREPFVLHWNCKLRTSCVCFWVYIHLWAKHRNKQMFFTCVWATSEPNTSHVSWRGYIKRHRRISGSVVVLIVFVKHQIIILIILLSQHQVKTTNK